MYEHIYVLVFVSLVKVILLGKDTSLRFLRQIKIKGQIHKCAL